MEKIFVGIEVPEGRYCNCDESICQFRIWDSKQKRSPDFYWCALYDKNLKFEGESFRLIRIPECLSSKSALDCGHHPDALMTVGTGEMKYKYCGACTMEKK